MWWQKDSPFSKEVLSFLGGDNDRVFWEPFSWSGQNSLLDRDEAGRRLADQMLERPLQHETVVYLSHSHGGNVYQNAKKYARFAKNLPRSISVGTPYLMETGFSGFGFFQALAVTGFYLAALALLSLKIFEFSATLDRMILVLAGIGFGAWFLNRILGAMLKSMSEALWGTGTWTSRFSGLSLVAWFVRLSQVREAKKHYQEFRGRNFKDIKIFSIFDEAILGLRKAHKQKITLANKQNSVIPATALWTIVLFVTALLLLGIFQIDIWNDPRFSHYKIVPSEVFDLSQVKLEIINTVLDVILFFGITLMLGFGIAESGGTQIFVRLFNLNLNNLALNKAVGKDSALSVSLPDRISPNLATLYGPLNEEDEWSAMPPDFDSEINDILHKGTIETARAIRETMAIGMLSGDFSIFESIARNFSGEELVHTSYFRHSEFAAFIAWIMIKEFGLPPSDKFLSLSGVDKYERWFTDISPKALVEASDRDLPSAD